MPLQSSEISEQTDTVIVGNGPSALILSYILHGHVPYYAREHRDKFLHHKLTSISDLLHVPLHAYDQFHESLKYSSQALPFNILLDTVLRPGGDTNVGVDSCVEWRAEPESAVPHIVLGDASRTGGQWADNPVAASDKIGALSYAEQLSLPSYTFAEHWKVSKGHELPALIRPTRSDISDYYAAYPAAVRIAKAFRSAAKVTGISRKDDGFHIASHGIFCRHLVLATGTFSINQPPPHFLAPLSSLTSSQGSVLVIGSGFTAAAFIISTPPEQPIIHIFNWDPENNPSPLRACHPQAYPEYAGIYRQMKLAASRMSGARDMKDDSMLSDKALEFKDTLPYFVKRDWSDTYEGLPNARITGIKRAPAESFGTDVAGSTEQSDFYHANSEVHSSSHQTDKAVQERQAKVTIGRPTLGDSVERSFSTFHYATGRRGSLSYLTPALLEEVLPAQDEPVYKSALDFDGDEMQSASAPFSPRIPLSPLSPKELSFDPHRTSPVSHDWATDPLKEAEVSGRTLRDKIARSSTVEVAPHVFAIGSLTGDSLVRFAYGGCCVAAGNIMDDFAGRSRPDLVLAGQNPVYEPIENDSLEFNNEVTAFEAGLSKSNATAQPFQLGSVPDQFSFQHPRHAKTQHEHRHERDSSHDKRRSRSQQRQREEAERQKGLAQFEQAKESLEGLTVFGARGSRTSAELSSVSPSGAIRLESGKSKRRSKGNSVGNGGNEDRNCIVC